MILVYQIPDYPYLSIDLTEFIKTANEECNYFNTGFKFIAELPNTLAMARRIIDLLNENAPEFEWFTGYVNQKSEYRRTALFAEKRRVDPNQAKRQTAYEKFMKAAEVEGK